MIPAYCYVARSNFTKVGLSFNPEHRMTLLGNPELRFKIKFNPYPVAYNAEALTKGVLCRHLAGGEEWFNVAPDHAIDVLIASGEKAFMAYCCDVVVNACNRRGDQKAVEALGLHYWVKAREYPSAWRRARDEIKQARRKIRMMYRALPAVAK